MSISRVSNRWLNRGYKCIAIAVVILAVFISALRLFLPYAHNYRQEVQDIINNTYQSNIIIGSLSMGWQKSGPTLITENVSLLDTGSADIFIDEIDLHIDFWRTLTARRLITSDFTMQGAKIKIDMEMNEITQQDASLIERISDLLLLQISRFSLRDSQIIIQAKDNQRTLLISELSWQNIGERHRAQGDVIFDGLTSNNLKMIVDINGKAMANMQGQVYLQANNVNITPWLDKILAIENEKTDSSVNFDAWLTVKNGKAETLQVNYAQNEVSWQLDEEPQVVRLDKGQLVARNLDNFKQFTLHATPLRFTLNDEVWEPITIQAKKTPQALTTYMSGLDIAGLAQLFPLFVMDEELKHMLAELSPAGKVSELYLRKLTDDFQVIANFNEVNNHFSHGIPGVEHLSGSLVYAGDVMQMNIAAEHSALDFDKHFVRPIPFNRLKTQLTLTSSENGWSLAANDLLLSSDELQLSASANVHRQYGSDVEMALLVNVSDASAKSAQHYYPHLLMGENLVNYLNQAIIDGDVEQAQVLFNGPLAKFPFEDNSGIFTVDAELSEAKFKFDPHWPAITDFAANLNFTNNSMLITGRDGELSGLDVTGVVAAIKNLSNERVLTVNAEFAQSSATDIGQLMNDSPMKATVGETLSQVVISQPVSGVFGLELPLKDPSKVLTTGTIDFNNNDIALQAPEMNFSGVNGQLRFQNDIITTDKLSVIWRGLPISLEVNAANESDYYGTNIQIAGDWQDKDWLVQVPDLLKKYSHGNIVWQGDLALYMHHNSDFSYELSINSDLYDTQLDLPIPYTKPASVKKVLSVNVNGQLKQSEINANLGDDLSFYGLLNHQSAQFSRAHLVLGDETMLFPTDGFHITTKLDTAELSQWQPFVMDIVDSINTELESHQVINANTPSKQRLPAVANQSHLLAKPERIRGTVNKLNLFGQTLTNVSFDLFDEKAWWLLQLNAKEARSQIKFYPDWHQQGIDVDADFIHLTNGVLLVEQLKAKDNEVSETQTEQVTPEQAIPEQVREEDGLLSDDIVFANIPPTRFKCDSCKYGLLDFGKVTFEIERERQNIVDLKGFKAQRDKSELNFDAYWLHSSDESKTVIEGKLSSKDVDREVERLGYASTIKDSGIKASYDFNWQGGPQHFSIPALNGQLSAALDDGYLADVSDKGARIFSVLSLQSLLRKLTLDFRDIFSDGMFYSSIKGDFSLKDGVLYTDNTKMNGAAGDLIVKGNTELANGVLDYRMSYKPNLTSSLPVLAWIASANPAVFLAGMAIDQVFTSKVVSEFTFEVTGNVDEPNVVQVDRKTKNVSVGRSTPPQIVENNSESDEKFEQQPELKPKTPNKSMPKEETDG
ncbi:YhdP family protein [Colwelliaceae bacterium 6471]